MARMLAIQWDQREAQAVVGNVRPGEVTVEQVFAVTLPEGDNAAAVGESLGRELAERGLTKLDTLVALGRGAVELRVLTLPAVEPDDLPDMVRFQAQREFSSLSENSPLDFVELERTESQTTVLAAAVPAATLKQITQVCQSWEAEPSRVVLRPFAVASLWSRSEGNGGDETVMLIHAVGEDADLTVLVDGHVGFLRTVRLPRDAEPEAQARALLGEVRRTMVAARSQTGGRRVDRIVWVGDPDAGQVFVELFAESLEQPVVAFDPFGAVTMSRRGKKELPADAARFAPLLGALMDEAHDHGHAIDFLHPRKRPAPPDRRRQRIVWAVAAAAVVLLLAGAYYGRLWMLDRRIAELESEIASQKEAVEKADSLVERAARLDAFSEQDVTWLDEIATAAQRIPPADDAILKSFSVSIYDGPGGRMFLKGMVRSPEMIRRMEDSLRYGGNEVDGKRGVYQRSAEDYHWLFDITVTVPPDRIDGGRSLGRPGKPTSAESAADPGAGERSSDADSAGRLENEPTSRESSRPQDVPGGTEPAPKEDSEKKTPEDEKPDAIVAGHAAASPAKGEASR